jgi:hypothetical protein
MRAQAIKRRHILQCVFICACKSDFVVTELLELIPLRETAAGEYIFVREFTKNV